MSAEEAMAKMEGMSPERAMILLKSIVADNFRIVAEAVAEAQDWKTKYLDLKAEVEGRLLTGVQAAELLGRSSSAVTKYRKEGRLKAQRVGSTWMYPLSAVMKLKEVSSCR